MECWAKKLKGYKFILVYIWHNGLQNDINWVYRILNCKERKRVEKFIVEWLGVKDFNVKEITKL